MSMFEYSHRSTYEQRTLVLKLSVSCALLLPGWMVLWITVLPFNIGIFVALIGGVPLSFLIARWCLPKGSRARLKVKRGGGYTSSYILKDKEVKGAQEEG